jgi:hypothetical protein
MAGFQTEEAKSCHKLHNVKKKIKSITNDVKSLLYEQNGINYKF